MYLFGYGKTKPILDKEGNEIDTSEFKYAYQFFLAHRFLLDFIDEPGVDLAARMVKSEINKIKYSSEKLDYTDIVRHENASSSGGISKLVIRNERRQFARNNAFRLFGNSFTSRQENT